MASLNEVKQGKWRFQGTKVDTLGNAEKENKPSPLCYPSPELARLPTRPPLLDWKLFGYHWIFFTPFGFLVRLLDLMIFIDIHPSRKMLIGALICSIPIYLMSDTLGVGWFIIQGLFNWVKWCVGVLYSLFTTIFLEGSHWEAVRDTVSNGPGDLPNDYRGVQMLLREALAYILGVTGTKGNGD